jgi:type IV secretory pathway TrbD component
MTKTASTYTADAIAAGMSTYPHPKQVLDTGALAEAIRVQLRTWVTVEFGVTVPTPEMVAAAPADSIAQILGEITEHVHLWGVKAGGDAEPWGIAHLFNAHADSLYAANGRGDAHLLGALYSLIAARAHLRDGHEGRFELDPFADERRTVNETTLIETIRVQLATWVPAAFGTVVRLPRRWEMRDAADLSDVIGDVIGAAEATYDGMDDDDSIRGMAHLANARAHGLKAGYSHGDAHLFAVLGALVLAAAALA